MGSVTMRGKEAAPEVVDDCETPASRIYCSASAADGRWGGEKWLAPGGTEIAAPPEIVDPESIETRTSRSGWPTAPT